MVILPTEYLDRGIRLDRTKYNVGKDTQDRSCDGIVFDSILEMRYYRDVLRPLVESGRVVEYELQKPYELQPKFIRDGRTVHAITYVADFYMVFDDGSVKLVDVKGCPDSTAILKRKLFWYRYPHVDYEWVGFVKKFGGWLPYEQIKKMRAAEKAAKQKESKEDISDVYQG